MTCGGVGKRDWQRVGGVREGDLWQGVGLGKELKWIAIGLERGPSESGVKEVDLVGLERG